MGNPPVGASDEPPRCAEEPSLNAANGALSSSHRKVLAQAHLYPLVESTRRRRSKRLCDTQSRVT